jgi:hypothetical protein
MAFKIKFSRKQIERVIWLVATLIISILIIGLWFDTYPKATIFNKYTTSSLIRLLLITFSGYFICLFLKFLIISTPLKTQPDRNHTSFRSKTWTTLCWIAMLLIVSDIAHQTSHRIKGMGSEQEYDPFLQNVAIPDQKANKNDFNRWGFRGDDIDKNKPPNTYRIFVVGGSTVLCVEVDHEHTHAQILQKRLQNEYSNIEIEVQNAGTGWHTSQHSLMTILFNIQDFNPDMIICFHAINDLWRSSDNPQFAIGAYKNNYGHFTGPVTKIFREYKKTNTPTGLFLVDAGIFHFQKHWFADFRDTSAWRHSATIEFSNKDWPSLAAFKRNMNSLAFLAKPMDFDLVMASQPFLYREDLNDEEQSALFFPQHLFGYSQTKTHLPSLISGLNLFNDTAEKIANHHKIQFIDLEQKVPKNLDYFLDDFHYTVLGNKMIGEIFANQIIKTGFITNKFPQTQAVLTCPPITPSQ